MNTRLSTSLAKPLARVSRAQFSPLPRRVTTRFSSPITANAVDLLPGRIWSKDLLDRLQAPLTRFRD
jgi:hypothetical protein